MNKTINELSDLIFNLCIPDGTVETFEDDDLKCHLEKDNGHLKIEIEANYNEDFDDSSTKEIVNEYKESIKALDDDLFLEVVDELKSRIDLTRFNELLDLEKFDEEQAQEVEEMIETSTDVICLLLQHKIQDMVELYDRF